MELMRRLITEFPDQIRNAHYITTTTPVDFGGFEPANVLILGMGGSGISGVIASCILNRPNDSIAAPRTASDGDVSSWHNCLNAFLSR